MDGKEITITGELKSSYGIGLLGATSEYFGLLGEERLAEIERRILRIEAALAAAGVEITP